MTTVIDNSTGIIDTITVATATPIMAATTATTRERSARGPVDEIHFFQKIMFSPKAKIV